MIYTVTEAISKLKKYCAYQERSQFEVKQKLRQHRISGDEANFVISELISENFLNEERYARAYARGKFNIKRWGKKKIVSGLRQKGVSETCIRMGLTEISESKYQAVLQAEVEKLIDGSESAIEKQKALRKLMAKGFETPLILRYIKGIDADYFCK